jgi:hypothetical protein
MAADVSRAAGWVWTVDLDWAGRRYRLAEQALTLPDVSGVILDYSPGLSRVGYEARLDLLETDPAIASVPIAVDLGPDLPVLLGDGHELRLAYAVVRLVPVDAAGTALGDYADGITIAAGTLRQIQTADPDAPTIVEAQVGDEPGQGTGPLLPPSGVIRQETWSTAADAAEGKAYPLVVGSPGSYPRGASTLRCPGSPVYVVTSSGGGRAILGVVAGHAVAAATVDVYNRTKDVWLTALPVVTTADLTERYRELYELHSEARDQAVALRDLANASLSQLGSAVTLTDIGHMYGVFGHPGAFDLPRSLLAVVDFSPLAVGDQPETEDELWAAWVDGPGLVDETGTEITTAGQLLLWLLRRSGLAYDEGRTVAVAGALTHAVSGYVNDPDLASWDYLQEVLAALPVTLARGPLGVYPVLLRGTDAPREAALWAWTAGEDATPQGPAQLEDATGPAAVRVAWGWDGAREAYRSEARVGLETDPGTLRVSTSGARTRATRYAGRGVVELEASVVGDLATAQRVGAEQLGLRSWPLTTRTYATAPGVVLELGDEGLITDAAMGWTRRRAVILGREWDGPGGRWLYRVAVREGAA